MAELELHWFDFYDPAIEPFVREVAGIWRRCLPEVGGDAAFAMDYDTMAAEGRPNNWAQLDVAAVCDGKILGAGVLDHDLRANLTDCTINIVVDKACRRQGVGTALFEELLREAKTLSMKRVQHWSVTAAGREPLGEIFAASHGFTEIESYRESSLTLPREKAAHSELEALTQCSIGDTYAVETYIGMTPEHTHEGLALMRRRMTTDAPHALDTEEGKTTADDIAMGFIRDERAGNTRITAIATECSTGDSVAFSELCIHKEKKLANQGETLVLREHRGHRLGLAVKLAALNALERTHPEVTSITTGNHCDNAPMLAVNDMLGFVETGRSTLWVHAL
ncbi:MAG: GNAT family N-acetyltransferase [Propionibacteriaceae bacterium]